jgi:hypothetical protein
VSDNNLMCFHPTKESDYLFEDGQLLRSPSAGSGPL